MRFDTFDSWGAINMWMGAEAGQISILADLAVHVWNRLQMEILAYGMYTLMCLQFCFDKFYSWGAINFF